MRGTPLANLRFFLYYSKNTAKCLVFFAPEPWSELLKKNFKITHIFMKFKIDDKYLDPEENRNYYKNSLILALMN